MAPGTFLNKDWFDICENQYKGYEENGSRIGVIS